MPKAFNRAVTTCTDLGTRRRATSIRFGRDAHVTDQHKRKTVDLRFPYDRQWRQGFPYIFGIVTGEVSVAAVGLSVLPIISTVLNGKIRSHPRFHAQQVR
jgi:hypothetical protein